MSLPTRFIAAVGVASVFAFHPAIGRELLTLQAAAATAQASSAGGDPKGDTAKADTPPTPQGSAAMVPANARGYVISHWPVTFVSGNPPGYILPATLSGTPTAGPSRNTVQSLATLLSGVFSDTTVQAAGDSLLIAGPVEHVRTIKIMLAKWIDVPFPVVGINVMSFQATKKGYDDQTTDAVEMATAGVTLAREFMRAYTLDLSHYFGELAQRVRDGSPYIDFTKPPLNASETEVQDLFFRFHLLGSKGLTTDTPESLADGQSRVKPFLDDLAYVAITDRQVLRDHPLGAYMETEGKALKLIRSLKAQLEGQKSKLRQALADKAITREEELRGEKEALYLESLCASLERSAYPAYSLFWQAIQPPDYLSDAKLELDFLREYSRPESYADLNREEVLRSKVDYDAQTVNDLKAQLDDVEFQLGRDESFGKKAFDRAAALYQQIYGAKLTTGPDAAAVKNQVQLAQDLTDVATKQSRATTILAALNTGKSNGKKLGAKDLSALKAELSSIQQFVATKQKEEAAILKSLPGISTSSPTPPSAASAETSAASARPTDAKGGSKPPPATAENGPADSGKDSISSMRGELTAVLADLTLLQGSEKELWASHDALRAQADAAQQALAADSNELAAVNGHVGGSPMVEKRPVDPESLTLQGANVDEMIKNATDAVSTDISAAILLPLENWIRAYNRTEKNGLVETGQISLAVTSSRGAVSSGSATIYSPFTPQQSLTGAQIASLLASGGSNSLFSSAGAGGILQGLGTLGGGQPLYSPLYTTVAPGLDLSVLPTVLPGGRAARLQINFKASNSATPQTTSGRSAPPIDTVNGHEVRTDVAVNAFDLFPLSSFAVETTALGDPQWRIYGLEGIPILGNMFVGPRRPVTTVGRSFIVVYSTIQPRSLDLARRYSATGP